MKKTILNIDKILRDSKSDIADKELSWKIVIQKEGFRIKDLCEDSVLWSIDFFLRIYPKNSFRYSKLLLKYTVNQIYQPECLKDFEKKGDTREIENYLMTIDLDSINLRPLERITYDEEEVTKIIFKKKNILNNVKEEVSKSVMCLLNCIVNPSCILDIAKEIKSNVKRRAFNKKLMELSDKLTESIPPEFRRAPIGTHLFINESKWKVEE